MELKWNGNVIEMEWNGKWTRIGMRIEWEWNGDGNGIKSM
jgi:hypothetical protein